MASNKKILKEIADILNMTYVEKECLIYGNYHSYQFLLKGSGFSENRQHIDIYFCVKSDSDTVELRQFVPKGCTLRKQEFTYLLDVNIKGSEKNNAQNIISLLDNFTDILEINHFRNCDEKGAEGMTAPYFLSGYYTFLTESTADTLRLNLMEGRLKNAVAKENYFMGTIGAILVALLASVVVFLFARAGYVTALSVLMGLTVYGYKWKGGKFSWISAIICSIVSIIFSYLTFRLDLAASIHEAVEISFSDAFHYGKEIMQLSENMSDYYMNLFEIAGICIMSTVVLCIMQLNEQKKSFQIRKIS